LQAAADLAEAEAVAANPSEDLADHLGFVLDDLIAGNTATVVLADIAVAVRRPTQHVHQSLAGGVQLAAAASLLDLGALVFRHHTLNLQQQVILGRYPDWAVEEDDLHPGAVQFIHQQDLIGIATGQAIRRVHINPIEAARRSQITQSLQGWTHQCRAAVAVIDEDLVGR
jgi:hypothetical protein